MKFNTPTDEALFNRMLSVYEEEFGASLLTVVIPKNWSNGFDCRKFAPITIKTWEIPSIGIRVEGMTAQYTQEV